MRNKSRKREISESRPTENKATNEMINQQVDLWFERIKFCGDDPTRTTKVLADLLVDIINGKEPRVVLEKLLMRKPLVASLKNAVDEVKRRGWVLNTEKDSWIPLP